MQLTDKDTQTGPSGELVVAQQNGAHLLFFFTPNRLIFCHKALHLLGCVILNGNLKPIGEGFFYCKSIKLAKSYETQRYEEYKPCFSGKVLLLACARPKYKETLKLLLAPLKLEMDTATDENKAFTKLSTGRLFDLALIDSKLQASASQGW